MNEVKRKWGNIPQVSLVATVWYFMMNDVNEKRVRCVHSFHVKCLSIYI